jgi:hypothetical protein
VPPLPVSAQARRQDPAVQHDPAPVGIGPPRARGSLARSQQEADEGRGIAPHCAGFDVSVVSEPVQWARMVANGCR